MRFALRSLARTPAFTALAILTLAVGIGTNTTIFAIVDELAFKPARVTGSDQVFFLGEIHVPDYETLAAERPAGVSAIAAYDRDGGGLLQIPGRAERVEGRRVTGTYAQVQNVRAQAGRWISDEDNIGGDLDPTTTAFGVTRPIVLGRLGANVCVISDRIWHEWFNAAPDVADRGTIMLNRTSMRIVGVAPEGFETRIDIWTPFGQRRLLTREELEARRFRKPFPGWQGPIPPPTQPAVFMLLRKDPGVAHTVINQRLVAALASRPVSQDMPASQIRISPRLGDDRLVKTGYMILGFAALIFLAACANLGNMLFARAAEREGELAVRLSLGATRFAIFGLLFAESIVICAAASAAGLLMAAGLLQMFTDLFPAFQVNNWTRVTLALSLDWRIAGYAAAVGLVAATVVGAGSLWRSSRVSLLARLAAAGPAVVAKTEGRTVRTMLVSVQVTAAVLLLIVTGMMLENTSTRLNRRVLFDTGSLVSATIELPRDYDESRGRHLFAQLLTRVRATEDVAAAALTNALPGGEAPAPRYAPSSIAAEAPPRGLSGIPIRLNGRSIHASPGFIDTLGLRVRGRDFRDTDEAGSEPVVLITESTARGLWPGEEAIGKRLRCCGATHLRRVVGVVHDPTLALDKPLTFSIEEAKQEQSGDTGAGVFVILPAAQNYSDSMVLVARSTATSQAVQAIGAAVAALDPAIPVFNAGPVSATQFTRVGSERAVRLLAGALGAIALGISVFGVYAIVSYIVTRRSREFGLRLALGSTRGQIVKLVIDYAIHIILIGLLPGVLLASLGTRYFEAELRSLHPNGLTVWIAVPILMLLVGVLAAYIPARRAARVNPYRSLKEL